MRLAEPMLLSAKAESPEGVLPSPQVRTATAASLRQCRTMGMGPTLGWRFRLAGTPSLNFGLFGEFVNSEVAICRFHCLDRWLSPPYISPTSLERSTYWTCNSAITCFHAW